MIMSVWSIFTIPTATSSRHSSGKRKNNEVTLEDPVIPGRFVSWSRVLAELAESAAGVTRDTTGTVEAMPHWAGESVASVEKVQPAAAIIDEFMSEAERLLHSWK